MPHPILQRLDIADVILQVAGRERVPEFVQKEIRAVRSFRTFVAVFRYALPAVQLRMKGNALQFELMPLVGPARLVWKDQRICIELR